MSLDELPKINQAQLAKAVKVSPATINLIIKHGTYPKAGANELYDKICQFLKSQNFAQSVIDTIAKPTQTPTLTKQEQAMLLRKQTLSQQAKRQFKLPFNPFTDNVRSAQEVYSNADIKDVREAL